MSCNDVCLPYTEEGLGIRNLETVNHVANMRHIWHIVSKKKNLCVEWVTRKHIRGRHFWLMPISAESSWIWRSFVKERDKAAHFIQHQIGNGRVTNMWLDP
ncbi:Ribonuclease h domain [Thalictrum thalictroides]|uniref:Ribonuclease h domain n=1 Tax=Thalictrum thalictroides TaxID=46969 RepID=A0A7J6X281_THATH|nr:Ribonuclease h domain [Thalictrum thalictroides]